MDQKNETAAQIRDWLKGVLAERGLSVTEWANAAKVARTTIARAIKDDYEFVTSSRTLAKLAVAAGVPAPAFAAESDGRLVPLVLPVRFRVQAGHWLEVDGFFDGTSGDFDHELVAPPRPVVPDPEFGEWPQWLEMVVGDSVDEIIPPGGYAHVVDAIEMGYAPQDGDLVVVERRRNQGALRERTIKQVSLLPSGVCELRPRSRNPQWSKPVALDGGIGSDEEVEVEIVGLVIGHYVTQRRR